MTGRPAGTPRAACLTVIVALGLLSGCGGSSPGPSRSSSLATFKRDYDAERTSLNAVSDQIGTVLTGASAHTDAQLTTELDLVEPRYRAELTKLGALKAPPEMTAAFATVKSAAGVLDVDLRKISSALSAHDASAAGAATRQLGSDVPALKTAADDLRKKLGLLATTAPAPAKASTAAVGDGRIGVVYDPPRTPDAKVAQEILHLGGTDGVASGLSQTFVLPKNLTIHAVNDFVGPAYDPQTKTITLSYAFVNYEAAVLQRNFPALRTNTNELGRELAAVDGFILLHELGHALIDVFGLPVLGREEDAADSVATVFLTGAVKNGSEYAFDAAKFFHALSARQRQLAPSDYWDAHSLDQQRAYSIVCWIAGSSAPAMRSVAVLGLLPTSRLASCPSEYRHTVQSWVTLLRPHVRA